jgi:hypothetical protein
MKTLTPDKMQRMAEFVAVTAEEIHIAQETLEKEFAKTPEGLEAAFLASILEHYLNNLANFLVHFISGEQGKRGVDELITGLQHKDSKVKTDENFIKLLDRQAKAVNKKNLPDFKEWQHYTTLKKDIDSLGPAADIHEFLNSFNALLVRAAQYPKTEVAVTLKAREVKKTPRTIELENYELAFYIWKLMLSRLLLPKQLPNFESRIGRLDPHLIKQAIKERLDSNRELHIKGSDDFFKSLDDCLPDRPESDNWDNLRGFAKKIKDNSVLEFLRKIGQGTKVDYVMKPFGKEGAALDQLGTITRIGTIIQKMRQDKANVETAARDELAKLVSDMVAKMDSGLGKEREKFANLLSSRIKELQKTHAKDLSKVTKMRESVDVKMERILSCFAAIENSAGFFASLEEEKRVNDEAFADVSAIISADIACSELLNGVIDENAFNAEIDRIVSTRYESKVSHTMSDMKQVMLSVRSGNLALEKAKEWIDKVFKSGMNTLHNIISKREHINMDLVKKEQELNREMQFANSSIVGADEELTGDMKELRKRGMDVRRFEQELPPEERRIVGRFD